VYHKNRKHVFIETCTTTKGKRDKGEKHSFLEKKGSRVDVYEGGSLGGDGRRIPGEPYQGLKDQKARKSAGRNPGFLHCNKSVYHLGRDKQEKGRNPRREEQLYKGIRV